MQGLTVEEFRQRFPDDIKKYESGDPAYMLPGGESLQQLYDRSVACCTELVTRHSGDTILVVTHSGVLVTLLHYVLGIPLNEAVPSSQFHAAINRFSISGDIWQLDT